MIRRVRIKYFVLLCFVLFDIVKIPLRAPSRGLISLPNAITKPFQHFRQASLLPSLCPSLCA